MFLVPTDTPGIRVLQDIGHLGRDASASACTPYIRYEDVRVPDDNLLGDEGKAFEIAQRRWAAAASTTPCGRSPCAKRTSR